MDRPRKVALLIETSNHYARELLHGVRAFMRKHEPWSIRLDERARGATSPPWLDRWRGDGVIARLESRRAAAAVRRLGVPVVNVSAAELVRDYPCVKTDDEAVARLAADHLTARGFERFGYCHVRGFEWSELRARYFREAVEATGRAVSVFPGAPVDGKPDPWRQDRRRLRRWIEGLRKPVGIMAAWDGCALQVLDACREIGAAVPDDVAVVGVDNDELLCDLATPTLTSVDPNPFAAGYLAAELLARLMAGEDVPPEAQHVPPVGIETRMSTEVVVAGDRTLAEAVRFIREHACAGIKVQDVLDRVPLSRRALESRFRKLFGRTPHEHILDLRLRRARDLLADTDLAQTEVAERSGFRHPEYLSVVFKKKFGESPGEFRRRSQR